MQINTKYFGQIEIKEENILTFPKGLPAFEDLRKFILLVLPDNNAFTCLQSIENEEIAFLMINPWDFFPEYDVKIPDEELEEIDITKEEQVKVYNIATIPKDPQNITINLVGPIIINRDTNQAKQIVLTTSNYHTKHPILSERKGV